MKGADLHTDKLFDALKNAFEDYQPDFSADELHADWSGVKSQISAPNAPNVGKPDVSHGFKSLLNLKNVIITSVSGVAIVATTITVLNLQKPDASLTPQTTTPTVQTIPQPASKTENTAVYNNPDKEVATEQHKTATDISNDQTTVTATQSVGKTVHSGSINTKNPFSQIQNTINNENKSPKQPEQTSLPVTENENIPRIIFTDNGFPKQDEIFVTDTQFCQNQSIHISYNFKDPSEQKLFVSLQGKAIYADNNMFSYQFVKPGSYNLAMVLHNYSSTITRYYSINVVTRPVANFNFNMSESPTVKFKNLSKNADKYYWIFGDNTNGSSENIFHQYPDTGNYKVILIASVNNVCADTFVRNIQLKTFSEPIIPNIFSPNNDGVNDEFYIKTMNEVLFELTIFDRNSNLVFISNNKNEKWNGNYKDTNKPCPAGTYFYFLNYKIEGQDQQVVKNGTITLFR